MLLSDIFKSLQYGELANVQLSGGIDAPRGITPASYKQLTNHVNKALIALHTRLDLITREVTIQQFDELSFYVLDSKFALSNVDSTEPVKYIIDSVERPFLDDVLQISAVYDESGIEMSVNDSTDCDSAFLPNYKTIQIPRPADDNTMFVVYRAQHPTIDDDFDNPSDVEVNIPGYAEEPLLTYIAARVHGSRLDMESQALSSELKARFDLQLGEIERVNLLHNTINDTNTKLGEGGWL